jgi:hypothetical protein
MNKIVREHYPVDKLPEDLRPLVEGASEVTIVLTVEDDGDDEKVAPAPLSTEDAVALMRQMQREASAAGRTVTGEEAVRRIRELRDEWDE